MSLTRSLDVARSHLSSTAEYMQLVSRNVARASDPFASRKTSEYITTSSGVRLSVAGRTEDYMLATKALTSTSAAARDREMVDALDQLNDAVGDPESQTSPAALIQKLQSSLQSYATGAYDTNRQNAALLAAKDLVTRLNTATAGTQRVRQQADIDISNSVGAINDLLGQFQTLNDDIVRGTLTGRDVTDQLDQRDQLVSRLSEEFGVRTQVRENNDMALNTESGVTLFDRSARKVTFQTSGAFVSGTTGSAVFVDGVPVTGPNAIMPVSSGRIAGLAKVRDVTATQFQAQLDEVARGLIETFSETGPTGADPQLAGLFTNGASTNVPPTGVRVVGLAGTIKINALVDPAQGGVANRLRDGINYDYNPSATPDAGFADRLNALSDEMEVSRAFDPVTGVDASSSVLRYSASSDGWLSAQRQQSSDSYDYTSVMYERATDALSKATGINVEEEYLVMLELERSYQASSKLIATVDKMFEALLAAAR